MTDRVLVIPDVHEKVDKLRLLEPLMQQADRVVFLGDFFDAWTGDGRRETAHWLKNNVHNDKYEFLLGNHDCHYAFQNSNFKCSGYDDHKQQYINRILRAADWRRFKVYSLIGCYTLSHAGFTADNVVRLRTREAEAQALQMAFDGGFHEMWQCGYARGGNAPSSGPTWLDWKENSNQYRPCRRSSAIAQTRTCESSVGRTAWTQALSMSLGCQVTR